MNCLGCTTIQIRPSSNIEITTKNLEVKQSLSQILAAPKFQNWLQQLDTSILDIDHIRIDHVIHQLLYNYYLIEDFIFSKIPNNNKHYHKIGAPSKEISGLKPNTCLFYFGTQKRLLTSPLKKFEDAYGNLKNSGVTRTDAKGNAKIFLDCPQIYISLNGNVYNRHLHFMYWNEKKNEWDKNLYTQPLLCHVDNDFVEKHSKKCLVIDALPKEYYDKKHIKGLLIYHIIKDGVKKILKN